MAAPPQPSQPGPVLLVPVAAVKPGSTSSAMPVVAASAYKPLEQPAVATCGRRLIPSPAACQCWEGSPLSVTPSPRLREAITSRPQTAAMQGRTIRRARGSAGAPASPAPPTSPAPPASPGGGAVSRGRLPPSAVAMPVSPAQLAASLQGPSVSPFSARSPPFTRSGAIGSPSRPQSAATAPSRPQSARAAPRQHYANGRRHLLSAAAGDGRQAAATRGPAATQLDFGGVGGGTAFLNQLDSLTERPPGFGGVCEGLGLGLATKQIAPHARSGAPSRGRPSSASPWPARRSPELPVEELRVGIVLRGGQGTPPRPTSHTPPQQQPVRGVNAPQTARIPSRVPLESEAHRDPPRRPRSARVARAAHVELEIFPTEVGPWSRDLSARPRGGGLRAIGSPTSSSPSPVTVPHGSSPPSRGEPMTLAAS